MDSDEEVKKPVFEETILYKLIKKSTKKAFEDALRVIPKMSSDEIKIKSDTTKNTYLHFIVLKLSDLHRKNDGDINPVIPVVYRLVLQGCDINAQNIVGNTCLHMACFRPHGEKLNQHFIRLGCDPGIFNEAGCRVIHHNLDNKCWLVRGQKNAKCSLWMAVQREDYDRMEEYMRSWCRVLCRRRRKNLLDVAYDTGNFKTVERLLKFRTTNELVTAALALDLKRVKELVVLRTDPYSTIRDRCDVKTCDCSGVIPKPLIAELKEYGPIADKVIQVLVEHGAPDETQYIRALQASSQEFDNCEFYEKIEELTQESLQVAWKLLDEKKVNIEAVRDSDGAGYLHYLVEKYHSAEDVHIKRLLVRLMYRLTLDGIRVQRRNNQGETALVYAYSDPPDRILLDHLVQMGVDSSIRSRSGHCISINTYATRGELLLQPQLNRNFMPGLWVAVEDGDIERVRHWLGNLCRVNTMKGGRTLMEVAHDMEQHEIAELLEQCFHETEFATATMAADINKMKHYIAMGNGSRKVNATYSNYFAGYTDDRKTEFVTRPLIINAMEYAPAAVTKFLIDYHARLDVLYEECAPCSPLAFWAFRDNISGDVSLVIAQTADLTLRDELGYTLLHRAILKQDSIEIKKQIVQVMLERGANVAARDTSGKTPRDLCELQGVIGGQELKTIIDDYVLDLCYIGEYDRVENFIIEDYDHILDIRDSVRGKSAKDLAYLRYYKELLELLDEIPKYQNELHTLHQAVKDNDMKVFVRLVGEKRLAFGVDHRGRNILHMAVLHQHAEMVASICEQFPTLISMGDNTWRTPVHYAVALRDQRATLSVISTSYNVDLMMKDAHHLTVLDYIEQVERPIPAKLKSRGRRVYDFQPRSLIEIERAAVSFINLEEP